MVRAMGSVQFTGLEWEGFTVCMGVCECGVIALENRITMSMVIDTNLSF